MSPSYLNPGESLTEAVAGLIMALSLTLARQGIERPRPRHRFDRGRDRGLATIQSELDPCLASVTRYVDANRWLAGFGLVAIGLVLVVSTILLGG